VFASALWLYIAFYYNRPEFVLPYCAAFACVAMNMYFERRIGQPRRPGVFAAMALGSLTLLAIGVAVLIRLNADLALELLPGLVVSAVSGIVISMLLRLGASTLLDEERHHNWRWHIRGLAALAGSVIAALPLASWTITQP
jgi:hypothetical protein